MRRGARASQRGYALSGKEPGRSARETHGSGDHDGGYGAATASPAADQLGYGWVASAFSASVTSL